MRQRSIALTLLLSAFAIIGCDAGPSSVTKLLPSTRGGSDSPGSSGAVEKALPAFQTEDQLVVLFNEMNRAQRILRNLLKTPVRPANSCTKYVSTPTKRGIFLVMSYERCGFTQDLSGGRGLYAFQINGTETYERKSSRVDVRSQLDVSVGLRSSKRASMRRKAHYVLEASGDDGIGKTKSVEYTSTYGTEAATGEDYWNTSVENGRWIQTGDADLLKMAKGTAFKLVYRSGKDARTPKTVSVELKSNDDIFFAEGCPWPVSGSFDVQTGKEKRIVTVSATGFTIDTGFTNRAAIGPQAETRWPTNHCLGVKQN